MDAEENSLRVHEAPALCCFHIVVKYTAGTVAVCRVPTVTRNAGPVALPISSRERVTEAGLVTPWSFSLSALRALRLTQDDTVAYFGLVARNTSLVAKGTSVQNVTLPRPLVPYTQLQ